MRNNASTNAFACSGTNAYELRELDYTLETVQLLFLVPGIHLAWANGVIGDRAEALIREAAHFRGIANGSPVEQKLREWLRQKPSDEVLDMSLRIIAAILHVLPPLDCAAQRNDLIDFCKRIAEPDRMSLFIRTGSPVCRSEELLRRIVQRLE